VWKVVRHNIVDPFEDTERLWTAPATSYYQLVTTSSIRSRILKVSPGCALVVVTVGHNIVDPFEDTESNDVARTVTKRVCSHNIVDPFEDTERKVGNVTFDLNARSHNIVDPFEDTERPLRQYPQSCGLKSQHRRSVRGY